MAEKICILVPTYNNAKTLGSLLEDLLLFEIPILVINDGSTDNTSEILGRYPHLEQVSYSKNRGKGFAIRTGFSRAIDRGFRNVITIDSDGQHFAKDIPVFLAKMQENPGALIIGARNMAHADVPGKSSFGNRFSNFWFWFETGLKLPDTQSGYRLYPIDRLKSIHFFTNKFEFEIEVIVRAAWKSIPVIAVPVSVYYPPPGIRVSHFRPFKDFTRISILNTVLVCITLIYIKPRNLIRRLFIDQKWKEVFIDELFDPGQSVIRKSISVGFGIFMGIVPIWGFQLVVAIFLAILFRLNKGLVIIFANISIPPMIPLIIYASYLFGGFWFTEHRQIELTHSLSLAAIKNNFEQYLVGSICLAITAGLIAGFITYILLRLIRHKNRVIES